MIYLLGSSGYVGTAFRKALEQRNIEYFNVERGVYTNETFLYTLLSTTKVDFVINCAGYTGKPNVDACELDKANCLQGNAVVPGIIASACQKANVPWGHVSSGCIYNGRNWRTNGWIEDDKPNFSFRSRDGCSWYSGTKALGEEILAGYDNHYVWRLRIPFNNQDNPRNYLTKLMKYNTLLNATNSLSHLDEFVNACIDSYLNKIPYGTYNVTNPGSIRTDEVVRLIKKYNVCDKDFNFFNSEADFMDQAAKTPRSNCTLDSSKIISAGIKLTPVQDAVEQALKTWTK